ncbi:MAG: hypothetical protein ABL985_07850 [Casimicrobium sp.]
MKFARDITAICFFLCSAFADATTWGTTVVKDPLDSSKTCAVSMVNSYGSYIYQWPSKYDQVFFPFTDEASIWYCETSGFVALIGDMESLSKEEIASITSALKRESRPTSFRDKVVLLERIYKLREKDRRFRNRLLRILARWHQDLDDMPKASELRKAAFHDIVDQLTGKLPTEQKLEYLYLAANYTRYFGDISTSDKYLSELAGAISSSSDAKLSDYASYLKKLANETNNIQPHKPLGAK